MGLTALLRSFKTAPAETGQANFLLAGQSNIAEWSVIDDGAVLDTFRNAFLEARPEYHSVSFFDVSRGGAALLATSAEGNARDFELDDKWRDAVHENYWYDEANQRFGPTFERAERRIRQWRAKKTVFHGVIWSQGESDVIHLDDGHCHEYQSSLGKVLNGLADVSGCDAIYIQELGLVLPMSANADKRVEAVRRAQRRTAAKNANMTIAATSFDLALGDNVHLTTESYHVAARRMAIAIATGERSPTVSDGVIANTGEIVMQVDLADSQRLEQGVSTAGFRLTSDGSDHAISAVRIESDGRIIVIPETPLLTGTISYVDRVATQIMKPDDYLKVGGERLTLPVRPFTINITT